MTTEDDRPGVRAGLLAGTVLAFLSLFFWKIRVIDLGQNPRLALGSLDLYLSHYQITWFGFSALREGRLPYWNPYQLCGEPFLAVPYVGLFYPLNFVYLLFDVPTGTEISFVCHMLLGALGMWWFVRHLGIGNLGALCSALTYAWSGWSINYVNQPQLFAALAWMPLTVLLLDMVLHGRSLARLGLVLAVACQVLLGTAEIFVHTMYAGALFVLCRLLPLGRRLGWVSALRRSGGVLVCLAAGVLLASFQLLPSIELTQLSVRAPGSLSLNQAFGFGSIRPFPFVRAALETRGMVTTGVLPLLGVMLALGFRRYRLLWLFCVIAAVGSASLVFGGLLFRLHYELPMGSMFRRPHKFLDIYSFAQAGLAGLAIARLQSWQREGAWMKPGWLACLGVTGAALVWLLWFGAINPYLAAALGLVLLFGIVPTPALRTGVIIALCILQGVNLFFSVGNRFVRPSRRPEIFANRHELITFLKERAGHERVYMSPSFLIVPGLTTKQGMMNALNVVLDYEPLAVGRYATFFDHITGGWRRGGRPFTGMYGLGPYSRWRLMDLTSTRYFVTRPGEPADTFMAEAGRSEDAGGFRLIRDGRIRVFENPRALSRAYVVPRARVLGGPDEVLAALSEASFDPRAEVLLEESTGQYTTGSVGTAVAGHARITVAQPEHIVIEVSADKPGFLVLTDLYYPGWKAFVGDREIPIYRANYLFRAVLLKAGSSEIRFEFRPASFRKGVALSVTTAFFLVAAVTVGMLRRRGRRTG